MNKWRVGPGSLLLRVPRGPGTLGPRGLGMRLSYVFVIVLLSTGPWAAGP